MHESALPSRQSSVNAADESVPRDLEAFVVDRRHASDAARRAAWQRCVALRAKPREEPGTVKVRTAIR